MKEKLNAISEAVIGAAIAVHRELGPGLLESAYEACLEFELLDRGFKVDRQPALPVRYRRSRRLRLPDRSAHQRPRDTRTESRGENGQDPRGPVAYLSAAHRTSSRIADE